MKKAIYTLLLLAVFSLSGFINAQTIAGGRAYTLAVCENNMLSSMGYNANGQLGIGNNTDSHVPVEITSLNGIIAVSCGDRHSLALKNDGTVWAWGDNSNGALGNGTNTNSNVPIATSALTGITAIAGGRYHSLALKNDGTVWAGDSMVKVHLAMALI